MQKRIARADLEIKSFDDKSHVLRGMATTPGPDRIGDVVEPMGARFGKEIPLFLYHDDRLQVGTVKLGPANKAGVPFEATLPDVIEPGSLKTRVEEAWHLLKYNLLKTVSIGFMPLNEKIERLKTGGLRWLETEILELSLVSIPMNPDAQVSFIKSIDDRLLAASGNRQKGITIPGASGKSTAQANPQRSPKGIQMETIQDSLSRLKESRETKAARMKELGDAKETEGRRFTDEERAEVRALAGEVEDIDDDISVKESQLVMSRKAKPVGETEGGRRSSGHIFVKGKDVDEKFKGENGLKRLMCQLQSSLDMKQGVGYRKPSEVADSRYGRTNPTLVSIMKANEIAGGGTDSGEPWAELAAVDNRYTGDFIEYLYGLTVFDQLPLRAVPHNVAIKGQDGAFTGYWVGQSKAIPMSQGSASSTSTAALKVAGLTVMSNELIRDSSPAALTIAGDGLREALAQVVDTKFFSTDAASAGVSPAGILNGLSAISTNGSDAESIKTDIKALFAPFITAKNAKGFVWVMTPTTALALSLMQNALGQTVFPGVSPTGGTFHGFPVYVGDNIGAGDVILLQPREIWKIADLGVQVSTSTEAMIEQSSAPTGATDTPVAATQYMTSMFQEESTAIKVVRPINFGKRRASAVAYVGNAAWGGEQS